MNHGTPLQLPRSEWQQRAHAHTARAREWTVPYRARRDARELHPIYDFLFIYYRLSPGQLETWHPGANTRLLDTKPSDAFSTKFYLHTANSCIIDPTLLTENSRNRLTQVLRLCKSILNRPAQFNCFGLHEWAMVYRGDSDGEIRHGEKLPLRVAQATINELVERMPICCSHFDAFRFFTPSAKPFNRLQPSKDRRLELEQAGCLHTNMDLYKLAGQCMPWIGSDLLWDCFQFALQARQLDMQASAYDCSSLGYDAIPVETPAGRITYQQRQQELAQLAQPLRQRLVDALQGLLN